MDDKNSNNPIPSPDDVDVKIVKLRNGETIIAGVIQKGNLIIITNPMNILIIPVKNKKGIVVHTALAFKNWMEYSLDTGFTLPKSVIMFKCDPDEDVLDGYMSAVLENFGIESSAIVDIESGEGLTEEYIQKELEKKSGIKKPGKLKATKIPEVAPKEPKFKF